MDITTKRKAVVAGVATLAVAGAGGAVAATKLMSPKQESQAIVDDAARQLGVSPSALSSALKKALENRVDAAVAAGRLTKAQGDAMKARIEAGDVPLFALGGRRGPGRHDHFGGLDAAASYLGLSETQLHVQLESGKTLAQVATAQEKAVAGLIDAMVADATSHLDHAVADGRLTKAQEQAMLATLKQHITDLVNGKMPAPPDGGVRGAGFGDGPPPGAGI